MNDYIKPDKKTRAKKEESYARKARLLETLIIANQNSEDLKVSDLASLLNLDKATVRHYITYWQNLMPHNIILHLDRVWYSQARGYISEISDDFNSELKKNRKLKESIADKVAELIPEGVKLFIGDGAISYLVALELIKQNKVFEALYTNNLVVAPTMLLDGKNKIFTIIGHTDHSRCATFSYGGKEDRYGGKERPHSWFTNTMELYQPRVIGETKTEKKEDQFLYDICVLSPEGFGRVGVPYYGLYDHYNWMLLMNSKIFNGAKTVYIAIDRTNIERDYVSAFRWDFRPSVSNRNVILVTNEFPEGNPKKARLEGLKESINKEAKNGNFDIVYVR